MVTPTFGTLPGVRTNYFLGDKGEFDKTTAGYGSADTVRELITAHYTYKTPEGMDEWVKPSEAIAFLVRLIAENYPGR